MIRSFILIIISIVFMSACEKPDREVPVAEFDIMPQFGDSLTVFHFDASNSSDNFTNDFRLKVRWDINSDGIWETEFTILKSFSFKFPQNGTYSVSCEVIDDDKNASIISKNLQVAPVPRDTVFNDSRDGREYKAVFLFDRWWMRDNLAYGSRLDTISPPADNAVAEYYLYPGINTETRYGGYYTWNEVTDYGRNRTQGICPEGWRIPNIKDIERIREILSFAKNYGPYLAVDEPFMLDFALSGKYFIPDKIWHMQGISGNFWIYHKQPVDRFLSWIFYRKNRYLMYTVPYFPRLLTDYQPLDTEYVQWQNEWGSFDYNKIALPLRCIKDHEVY